MNQISSNIEHRTCQYAGEIDQQFAFNFVFEKPTDFAVK